MRNGVNSWIQCCTSIGYCAERAIFQAFVFPEIVRYRIRSDSRAFVVDECNELI